MLYCVCCLFVVCLCVDVFILLLNFVLYIICCSFCLYDWFVVVPLVLVFILLLYSFFSFVFMYFSFVGVVCFRCVYNCVFVGVCVFV